MKKPVVVLMAVLLAAPALAGEFFDREGPKVEGEFMCKFVPGVNARAMGRQLGAQTTYNALNLAHFVMDEQAARALARNPNIAYCEPNMIARVDGSGSQSGATWGIDRVDQRDLPLDGTYNWDFDGANVDAWILDTGVRTTHNEFGGRASVATDCGFGNVDGHGHGSHVAGTAGGATYGVAKSVTIKAIKVCNDSGSCPTTNTSCGLNYVANNAVANNSVGNFSIGGGFSQTSNDNMANAIAAGVFFAVAAGNSNADACGFSPASEPTAYTVGSTTSSDARSSFSNYGSCLDIMAPGSSITSAWYTSDTATNIISGTSMATPHVCGAGALVLSQLGPRTPAQIDAELDSRATTGVISDLLGSPDRFLYTRAPMPCTVDADCDNGLFCDGAETCNAGFCASGSDPCAANPTWTCNETTDVCDPECTVDADCDDGLYCNSAEVCNAGTCGAGIDPCPGQCCDEATASCGISNDPQNAAYDAGLGAPACPCGSSCDSQGLLDGRANLGPELNQPNTVDTCTDGTSGTYHNDESNDRIVVTNLSGTGFTEGDTVEIAATVWAWSTGSSDTADFYYAADATNPTWTYIGSVVPPAGGAHTLTQQYTLPAGSLQAVRVNFRYSGSTSSCSGGSFDDADDLVFSVASAGGGCTSDAECDDGAWCNGAEVCNAGVCEAGTAPNCDDGVSCTVDTCDEGADACDNTPDDSACDNGLFCDGAETCDAVLGCQAGTPPNCDDGVACTDDSCDDVAGCINSANDANCTNGLFCDGAETCDAVLGCQAGVEPCPAGQCDEAGDVCVCKAKREACTFNTECCSGVCKANGTCR